MCMSPHQMTSATIELRIQEMRKLLEDGPAGRDLTEWERNVYSQRLEWFEEVLKERANDGTYHTAGV